VTQSKQRRHFVRRATAALAVLLLGSILSSCGGTVGRALGTEVPPRDILSIQMLSASNGVGVGVLAPRVNANGIAYLVRTDDGGATWRIAGAPLGILQLGRYSLFLGFSSRENGYISGAGVTDVTDNGGATWTPLTHAGRGILGWGTQHGRSLWMVVMRGCGPGPSCNSFLVTFRNDSSRASSYEAIPAKEVRSGLYASIYQYMVGPTSATSGVVVAAPIGGWRAIFLTTDSGATWTRAADPGPGWVVDGFVQPTSSHWVALCDQGPGSEVRAYRFMQTMNGGRSWSATQTLLESGPRTDGGALTAAPELALSGDKRTIWLVNARGQLSSSSNWGRTWSPFLAAPRGGAWWPTTPFDAIPGSQVLLVPDPGVGVYRIAGSVVTLME
jgi:hypothetical protein